MFKTPANALLVPVLKVYFIIIALLMVACSKPNDFNYLRGHEAAFDDLKGQWTVINYWAEWCKPCIKEIPELNALDANNAHIKVIGINFDQPQKAVLMEQSDKLNIKFDNILIAEGPDPFLQRFAYEKPKALPTTVIITPNLSVKVVLMGPQDEATLSALINGYVSEQ